MLTKEQIDAMLRDVAWVESLGDSMVTVRDVCYHVKALAAEVDELRNESVKNLKHLYADYIASAKTFTQESAYHQQLLACKDQALDVFADPKMWAKLTSGKFVYEWNGKGQYENPIAFAARERDRTCPSDSIGSVTRNGDCGAVNPALLSDVGFNWKAWESDMGHALAAVHRLAEQGIYEAQHNGDDDLEESLNDLLAATDGTAIVIDVDLLPSAGADAERGDSEHTENRGRPLVQSGGGSAPSKAARREGSIPSTGDLDRFIVRECPNSTAVMGPANRTEGSCLSRSEICRCTSWQHRTTAQRIAETLNREWLTEYRRDITTPWHDRGMELESVEGPYCFYAAWEEWAAKHDDEDILCKLNNLDKAHLYHLFELAFSQMEHCDGTEQE